MIPVVFIVPAAATGIAGAGKTIKSVIDNWEANRITGDANLRVDTAQALLERSWALCADSLSNLGEEKLFVLNNSIAKFIASFEQIKNLELVDSLGLEELRKLKIDKESMEELKEMQHFAATVAGSVKSLLDTPILTEDGALTVESEQLAASLGVKLLEA